MQASVGASPWAAMATDARTSLKPAVLSPATAAADPARRMDTLPV